MFARILLNRLSHYTTLNDYFSGHPKFADLWLQDKQVLNAMTENGLLLRQNFVLVSYTPIQSNMILLTWC